MIEKPDDREPVSNRARRYIRGIALAMTLTCAALLFLVATLHGENRNAALAQPEHSHSHSPAGSAATEPSALVRTGAQ